MTLSLQLPSPTEVRAERARRHLMDFTEYTFGDYRPNWHHRTLAAKLEQLLARQIRRLMVFMPPQHGKSELVSRRLPAFALGRDPDARIILASYSSDLADAMNLDVQRIIDSERYGEVFPRTFLAGENGGVAYGKARRSANKIEIVGHRGSLTSAGVGGGITGMSADLLLIDDPIKNQEEADSETVREAIWAWYTTTAMTRLAADGVVLLTMTRWHEADLAGKLLELSKTDPRADQWEVLLLPAVAEDAPTDDDPRALGTPLWLDRYPESRLDAIRIALGPRRWSALYRQQPRPREGNMFNELWFNLVDEVPIDALRVRYWDKGATEGAGDYTAGVLMAGTDDGLYWVEDVVRGQWSPGERDRVMKQTAAADALRHPGYIVYVWVEQEPGSGGKESAQNSIKLLAGHSVHVETSTGDKQLRADPLAAQAEAGNVRMLRGQWNASYLDEMTGFPFGKHDDQVDASSGAFNKLALGWETTERVVYDDPVEISPDL